MYDESRCGFGAGATGSRLHTQYANLSRSHSLICTGEAAMYVLTEYSYVCEPYVPSTALLDPSLGHNAESTKKWKRKQRN